jgi:ribosomal protein S18 acetylase RimI-like enzyme
MAVRFEPMTGAEFLEYMETAVEDYAQAHLKSGDCEPDEALALAKADYDSLLPEGISTPGQHLVSIYAGDSESPIGMLWFELKERRGKRSAYIFDFVIAPEHRGKGFGKESLQALEAAVRDLGARRIGLHVMGWNTGARALYEKAGFTTSGILMNKLLA